MESNTKLDDAVRAMLEEPIVVGPPAAVDADLKPRLRQAVSERPIRAGVLRPTLLRLALAACLVLVVGLPVAWFTFGGGAQVTFADVLKKMQSVRTAYCNAHTTWNGKPMDNVIRTTGDGRMRVESSVDGKLVSVSIFDARASKMLMLIIETKWAFLTSYEPSARQATAATQPTETGNPWDWVNHVKPADAQKVDEKKIDGRTVQGFKLADQSREIVVWVDPTSALPVEVQYDFIADGKTVRTMTMTGFKFDEPLDESLFALTPPNGYTDMTEPVDLPKGPLVEVQLVELFRSYTRLSGGAFPPDLEWATIIRMSMLHEKPAATGTRPANPMDNLGSEGKRMIMMLGGATSMFYNAGKDGWAYTGDGATLGDANRRVLWYRKPDRKTYRVIFADLHVEDASEKPATTRPVD